MGLRALKGLPQKYKFPLSFGAIDALRQADEGPVESAKAFAQGATIGKYIEWAGPLAPVSRVTSTGALGFALPAEDVGSRISNAIIFGGTSIFPLGGRQTILDRKISDTVRNNRQQKAIVQFEKQFLRIPHFGDSFPLQIDLCLSNQEFPLSIAPKLHLEALQVLHKNYNF